MEEACPRITLSETTLKAQLGFHPAAPFCFPTLPTIVESPWETLTRRCSYTTHSRWTVTARDERPEEIQINFRNTKMNSQSKMSSKQVVRVIFSSAWRPPKVKGKRGPPRPGTPCDWRAASKLVSRRSQNGNQRFCHPMGAVPPNGQCPFLFYRTPFACPPVPAELRGRDGAGTGGHRSCQLRGLFHAAACPALMSMTCDAPKPAIRSKTQEIKNESQS